MSLGRPVSLLCKPSRRSRSANMNCRRRKKMLLHGCGPSFDHGVGRMGHYSRHRYQLPHGSNTRSLGFQHAADCHPPTRAAEPERLKRPLSLMIHPNGPLCCRKLTLSSNSVVMVVPLFPAILISSACILYVMRDHLYPSVPDQLTQCRLSSCSTDALASQLS